MSGERVHNKPIAIIGQKYNAGSRRVHATVINAMTHCRLLHARINKMSMRTSGTQLSCVSLVNCETEIGS